MELIKQSLQINKQLLSAKVSKHALYGLLIGCITILIATLSVCYQKFHALSLSGIIDAQTTNFAIWFLDFTPFLFSIWGQKISDKIAQEANIIMLEQTKQLTRQSNELHLHPQTDLSTDSLTGLPNRALFFDRLKQALSNLRKRKHATNQLALMVLELANFNRNNTPEGQYLTDRLIKQLSIHFKKIISDSNTLARLDDITFAIILSNVSTMKDVIDTTRNIYNIFCNPIILTEIELNLDAYIGIALAPAHSNNAMDLMHYAESALAVAKKTHNRWLIYSTKLDKDSQRRTQLTKQLLETINNDGLILFYQPKFNIHTQKLSMEALLRWPHPEFGMIAPLEFIPLAEQSGVVKILGEWTLNKVLQQYASWLKQGEDFPVSINLSAIEIIDSELPDKIAGQLAGHLVQPKSLTVEITENTLMYNQDVTLKILNRLARIGVKISLDDFGTGYSSLDYLTKLPLSELKIDGSFVMNMHDQPNNITVIKAAIDLAHTLNLTVVAENVEDEKTFNRLKELGCDTIQGYYISRPLDPVELSYWLNTSKWAITR